ncbi:MAG: hypothetical protein AB7Q27_11705 [Acidimicrobiia bacterium]
MKLDHERHNRRLRRAELGREANYEGAKHQNQRTFERSQDQLARFARAHRHENRFCASVADQVDGGRPISRPQAAKLREIAAEHEWPIPSPKHSSTHRRTQAQRAAELADPAARSTCERARELVASYTGSNGWLRYLRMEFAKDPEWLPRLREAEAIMREAA